MPYYACYFALADDSEAFAEHFDKYRVQQLAWHDEDDADSFRAADGVTYVGMDMCSEEELEAQLAYLDAAYTIEPITDNVPLPFATSEPETLRFYRLSAKSATSQ